MKRMLLVLVVMIQLFFLSGCYTPSRGNSVFYNDRQDLLVLFEYTVPFVDETGNDSIGDVEVYAIEEDKYGRTLGVMQFNSEYSNYLFGENRVYCVLQESGNAESCFYEDICCTMVENEEDPQTEIEQLKKNNDWGLPLQPEKCIRIPIQNYQAAGEYDTWNHDHFLCLDLAVDTISVEMEQPWIEVLCKDGCGLWLFTMSDSPRDDASPVVLIMMKEMHAQGQESEPTFEVVGWEILENHRSPWQEIRDFKEDMGWKGGSLSMAGG